MSSTPKDPSPDGRAPPSSPSPAGTAPRPNVDPTLFGVAPASPPRPAALPPQEVAPSSTAARPAPASESAIVAAPVIAVSDGKDTPASSTQSPSAPAPRADSGAPLVPFDPDSNRTALSSEYLRAARNLAVGQPAGSGAQRALSGALQPLPIRPTVDHEPPAPFAPIGATGEFAAAPVVPARAVGEPALNQMHGYATQRSVAPPALNDMPLASPGFGAPSQPAPTTPAPAPQPARSIASTLFDPPELPPLAAEPLAAPASASSRAPAFAARFEPVPAPRAALSDQMLGAFAPPPASDPVQVSEARASGRVSADSKSPAWRVGVAVLAAIALAGVGFMAFSEKSPIGNRLRTAWSGQPERAPMAEAVSDEAIRAQMLSNRAANELQRPLPPSAPAVDPSPEPIPSSAAEVAPNPAMAKAPGQVSVSFASDDKPKTKGKGKASQKARARAKRHKAAKPATLPAPD